MDQSMLKNSDALIMTGITQAPTANPDAMLGEFCTHLGKYNNMGMYSSGVSKSNILCNLGCITLWPLRVTNI